jgi:hypothetical protein
MNPFTMRSKRLHLITAVFACFVFFSCDRTIEELTSEPPSNYLPLQAGKYITYRVDSTVFTNFGTTVAVRSFQEKHIVDAKITDALGRESYRILRFTRDTAGTQPWAPAGTYAITPTDNTIEVTENNLRFVKLVKPVKQDNSWKGNHYLPDDAYDPLFSFSIVDAGMKDWDYTYSSMGDAVTIKGQTYIDVLTVDVIDIVDNANENNATVINSNTVASVNQVQDKYAKGLGLIYQKFVMWEYQPPNGSNQTGAKVGFGIVRSIIDHN